jgi:hypothetical protein
LVANLKDIFRKLEVGEAAGSRLLLVAARARDKRHANGE